MRLHKGYVDDGRQGTDLLIRGSRYDKTRKRFVWKKELEDEDNIKDESDEERMASVCLEAMNDLNPDLKFTVETRKDFQNGRLATLDFEVDVIDGIICYWYFQKSMRTPLVMMADSAMSDHQKYSIMTNELVRRLSNTQAGTPIEDRVKVIDQYTQQLKNSGYNWKTAREIIVCGLLGLVRKIARRERKGEKFHRKAASTLAGRYRRKLTGKENWYRE